MPISEPERKMRISRQTREARDRGAALLDAARPEWRASIDKDKLDMTSGTLCVLGLLYGLYGRGLVALGHPNVDEGHEWGQYHGFVGRHIHADSLDYANHADALRRAWLEII